MRWLLLILCLASCQEKVDDSDFVTAYLERDTVLNNSRERTEAMMGVLNKVDTIIVREEKRIDDHLQNLKQENAILKDTVNRTKLIIVHDTIIVKEKTNFWGKKKVSVDSIQSIDSTEYK